MDPDLDTYLEDLAADHEQPEHIRTLATSARKQWEMGIIPSEKTLRTLSKALERPEPCTRICYDGACSWLRANGTRYNLPVPPRGERAMCPYTQAFTHCPGYKKTRSR
jgi:hypothetical protein